MPCTQESGTKFLKAVCWLGYETNHSLTSWGGEVAAGRGVADQSPEGKRRLAWIEWYNGHGKNARKTCWHFSISPDTFYCWLKRYQSGHLSTLEDSSSRSSRRVGEVERNPPQGFESKGYA